MAAKTIKTCVFWDAVDFPFPNGPDPALIYENMKSAFENKFCFGCLGELSIMAYVDKEKFNDELFDVYEEAGIIVITDEVDKYARAHSMVVDIAIWAIENPWTDPKFSNLIVISKKNELLVTTLEDLKGIYHNVLLAMPDDLQSSVLPTVSLESLSLNLATSLP